jgi:hypothetical protein
MPEYFLFIISALRSSWSAINQQRTDYEKVILKIFQKRPIVLMVGGFGILKHYLVAFL